MSQTDRVENFKSHINVRDFTVMHLHRQSQIENKVRVSKASEPHVRLRTYDVTVPHDL